MSERQADWRAWVEYAGDDFLTIKNNRSADVVPWRSVAYHAQQGAERMLKAFLVSRGVAPRRTHDLVALIEECAGFDSSLRELVDFRCFRLAVRWLES